MIGSVSMKTAVAAFVVVAAALPAGQEKPGLPAAAVTALDQLIAAEQAKARVPGVSVAIAWKNELVYSRAFGFADLESQSAATPRTAFIISHSIDQFLADHRIPVTGPMQDYLAGHYRELFRLGDFSFMVPTESRAVAFGRYELLKSESADPALPPALFRSNVLLDGQPAQIRLEQTEHPWSPGPDLLAPPLEAFAEPITREGRLAGPAVRLPARQPLHGLYRLSIFSPRLPATFPLQDYLLVVRDPAGRLLSESVY